jgi:4-amino-4-deoxy-L-arabinose transferase-like glycosyltransferase
MSKSVSFWRIYAGILLLALIVYLVGNQRVGLWDRDEPRYSECAREMVETGDWVIPRYLGQLRLEKPPLIYWCQAVAMSFLGPTPAAPRLPSALGVLGAGAILGLTVRHFIGAQRALWTTFIFCTSGLAWAAAKFCNTDGLLIFFILGAQACLATIWGASLRKKNPPIWVAPLFWLLTGLAGLTKGPVVLGMHATTLGVLWVLDVKCSRRPIGWRDAARWWRDLHPLTGAVIVAAVVCPWLIKAHYRLPGFLTELWERAFWHASKSMDGHGEPPGYHLLLIFGTFFPWSVLLPLTISQAWRHRQFPAIRFAAACMIGPWLLMEMVVTKLPFYVLPAFGGLSFLTADALVRCIRRQVTELQTKAFIAPMAVWSLVALFLGFFPWVTLSFSSDVPRRGMIGLSAASIVFVAIVALRFAQGRVARAAVVMGVGTSMLVIIIYTLILPNLGFLQLSQRLAADLPPEAKGIDVPLAMIGYKEPSLAYYQGGGAFECEYDTFLQRTPPADWPKWVVITQEDWQGVPANLQAMLKLIAIEKGIAYAAPKGQAETVLLLEKLP